jgi:Ca2+-binding EF-hand superfamily protein
VRERFVGVQENSPQILQRAFALMDKRATGKFDKATFRTVLHTFGVHLPPPVWGGGGLLVVGLLAVGGVSDVWQVLEDVFRKYDTDADGFIDYKEFVRMVQDQPAAVV